MLDENEAQTFAAKLEAFYDTLTDNERQAFMWMTQSEVDVEGFAFGSDVMFWRALVGKCLTANSGNSAGRRR
jgi:hypothetical protein